MRLGSLFDGIGGFCLAAVRAGINPVWSSEIEPFPMTVTKIHFPEVKHLGDVTKIDGAEVESVDIITFGSPCQDLSVAGKRAGLDGERSGLFVEAIRIISEMRRGSNGAFPRFAVWENVPGAFSSAGGEDFRTVIEMLRQVGEDKGAKVPMPKSGKWEPAGMVIGEGYSLAWRVLDAQYWGVPQRRKRIFLVADFGGQCAGEILFKPESLRGDFAESSSEGQRTTENIAFGVGESNDVAHCLRAGASKADKHESTTYIVHPQITGTLCASGAGMSRPAGMASETDLVVTIPISDKATRWKGGGSTRNGDGSGNGLGVGKPGDPMATITVGDRHSVYAAHKVRRLTPLECERLQGLPDGWTDIPGASDTARYKAIGNGLAQPHADFVIRRIKEAV